jgi:ferritin-like metal-binding protein YciE
LGYPRLALIGRPQRKTSRPRDLFRISNIAGGSLRENKSRSSPKFEIPNVMELETLKDLYIHELKDLYSAEKQLTKALPKMAKAATSDRLADGFRTHLDQTEEHVNRLEKILESQNASTRGAKCKGMEGLIEEGEEMIKQDAEDDVRDAGLISAAQRVEHYEIAGYGCARTYAELLGDTEGARLLQQTLDEEGATNKKLTELAKTLINIRAQAI